MRKLVTKSANGASLRADFNEALRMVQLRGLSGDAKRAASTTLRQPATKTPNGLARISNPSITSTEMVYCFTPLLRQKATTRPPQSSCRPAHKPAHQLAFQAFTDWQWMRGHTLQGMPGSEPGDNFSFLSRSYQPSLPSTFGDEP